MRALIVYESIYGNTHTVAEGIARGLGAEVAVVPVEEATRDRVEAADLLVVGGPTHVHGMTWAQTRKVAVTAAEKDDGLVVEPDAADGPGLRAWMNDLGRRPGAWAAAFDTRLDASAVVTGRASKEISHRLRHHGFGELAPPESFLVDKESHLLTGEADRAVSWGAQLARAHAEAVAARAT